MNEHSHSSRRKFQQRPSAEDLIKLPYIRACLDLSKSKLVCRCIDVLCIVLTSDRWRGIVSAQRQRARPSPPQPSGMSILDECLIRM